MTSGRESLATKLYVHLSMVAAFFHIQVYPTLSHFFNVCLTSLSVTVGVAIAFRSTLGPLLHLIPTTIQVRNVAMETEVAVEPHPRSM